MGRYINMSLDLFIQYCTFNEITFSKDLESYNTFHNIWEDIYKEDLSLDKIKIYVLEIENSNNLGIIKKTFKEERIQKFIKYSIDKNLVYQKSAIGNKQIAEIWYRLFNIHVSLSTTTKYRTIIKRLGYIELFSNKIKPSEIKIKQFSSHCIKNKIKFKSSEKLTFRREWELYFNSSISLATASRHINKLKNADSILVYKEYSKIEKIKYFLKYCEKENIYFYNIKKDHEKMILLWENKYDITLSIATAIRYFTELKKLQKTYNIIKPYTSKIRIDTFIKYCIEKNIYFYNNKEGTDKIKEHWYLYHRRKISLKTAEQYQQKINKLNSNLIKVADTNHKIINLDKNILSIIEHLLENNKSFNSNWTGYKSFQTFWNNFFDLNTTYIHIKEVVKIIKKKNSSIFCTLKLYEKINIFIEKNSSKKFIRSEEGYKDLQENWNIQFKEHVSYNLIRKYSTLIIRQGGDKLFENKDDLLINKLTILANHCEKNKILIDRGTVGYTTIQELWKKHFNTTLLISTAMNYTTKLKKLGYSTIFMKIVTVDEKVDTFIKYSISNDWIFERNKDGYSLLTKKWNTYFNEEIKVDRIKFYIRKKNKNELNHIFKEKGLFDIEKIQLFIKNCKKLNIIINRGKKGYEDVMKKWNTLFDENKTLKQSITLYKNIRKQNNIEDIFIKENIKLKDKYIIFYNYCKKENIIIQSGKEGDLQIKDNWFLCFGDKVKLKTANKYAIQLRKYTGLFSENKFNNNSKFKLFKYYCIQNKIVFFDRKIRENIINTWNICHNENLPDRVLRNIIINLSYIKGKYYFDDNENNEIYIHIVKYYITNHLTLTKANTSNYHVQKIWKSFYKKTINIEEASLHLENLLKEFKIYNKLKWKLFGNYCKENSIYFREDNNRDEKIQLAWKECFDNTK